MVNIGILGCSEIAFRRFMPAVLGLKRLNVVAVAEEYDRSKLTSFCDTYKIGQEESFEKLIMRGDVQAIYIPQPPALHYKWARTALENGKHVLLEKPATTAYTYTKELVDLARKNKLALHENYMFQYHSQISGIKKMIENGVVGELRMIRANFGFPLRANNDFRYSAALGGGALLDAGGYAVKLATLFLGNSIKVDTAHLNMLPGYEVDMYGNATLSNKNGEICQIGFGMDCSYQCSLEIWGSLGMLRTNRIFTAPPGYKPEVIVETAHGSEKFVLEADAHFQHSIEEFFEEIVDEKRRNEMYDGMLLQARLIDEIRR